MKTTKKTIEAVAYSEEEAKEYLDEFKANASKEGYTVGKAGYVYKTKKAKGEIVAEIWVCTCQALFNEIWGDEF